MPLSAGGKTWLRMNPSLLWSRGAKCTAGAIAKLGRDAVLNSLEEKTLL